jgi:hypothetical protein
MMAYYGVISWRPLLSVKACHIECSQHLRIVIPTDRALAGEWRDARSFLRQPSPPSPQTARDEKTAFSP